MAFILTQIIERVTNTTIQEGEQHVTTYSLQKGIKKFGQRGVDSALKEMKQLHDRDCFKPILPSELNDKEMKWLELVALQD